MPFVDTNSLRVIERLPGWYGRYFHSPSLTFAHYDFKRGSDRPPGHSRHRAPLWGGRPRLRRVSRPALGFSAVRGRPIGYCFFTSGLA